MVPYGWSLSISFMFNLQYGSLWFDNKLKMQYSFFTFTTTATIILCFFLRLISNNHFLHQFNACFHIYKLLNKMLNLFFFSIDICDWIENNCVIFDCVYDTSSGGFILFAGSWKIQDPFNFMGALVNIESFPIHFIYMNMIFIGIL